MITVFLIALFGFIAMNIPIAFAMLLTAIVLMLYAGGQISPVILAQSVVRGIDNFPLMAIPFFMLAGELMNVGGISRRIVEFSRALIGHVVGGLGYVSVISAMIFAGISGSAIADTSAIGSIMLPIMYDEGYEKKKSTALISAAGCIGPIIPPSIPMILFGVVAGVSITKMFLGGIIPGILIGVALMIIWYFHAKKQGYKPTGKFSIPNLLRHTRDSIFALVMPIIILGGILTGICTPTEAGVVATVYALLIGFFVYRELKLRHLPEVLLAAAKTTAIVLFVVGAATAAAYLITTAQVPALLAKTLLSISHNPLIVMLMINILLLIVGCVMDLTPALLLLAPILLPVVTSLGIDPVYFGVVMVINLCIGLITPPVGTVLYVGCGLSKLSMSELTPPIVGFIAVMVAVLFLVTYCPPLITYIPYHLAAH